VGRTALWQVCDDGPRKLAGAAVSLEQQLEDWIARHPDLLQNGLTVVGRQVRVESGTIDLLAIDPQGRWAVIELKRSYVGRDAIAQALDYASCVATMPFEQLEQACDAYLVSTKSQSKLREILINRTGEEMPDDEEREPVIFLAGARRYPGLERIVNYLAERHGVPINVVTFEVFETVSGERILVRELSEAETESAESPRRGTLTVEEILRQADAGGVADGFRRIHDEAQQVGLSPVPWKRCIRYAPPGDRRRCLFTVWSYPVGPTKMQLYVYAEGFREFYPVTEQEVAEHLGNTGWVFLEPAQVEAFVEGLSSLFALIRERRQGQDEQNAGG